MSVLSTGLLTAMVFLSSLSLLSSVESDAVEAMWSEGTKSKAAFATRQEDLFNNNRESFFYR